jgi:hypothetical protein
MVVVLASSSTVFAGFKEDFYTGKKAFDNKQYTAASHYFNRALNANPNSEVSRYYLAITQAYLKEYEKARENYTWLVDKGNNQKIKKLAGEGLIYLPQKRKAASQLRPMMTQNINKSNYIDITFAKLKEYKYNWQLRNPPPASIKELENRNVHVKGYMIPLQGGEYFQKFLIVNVVPDCFFCNPPPANQVVFIDIANGKINYINDKPVDVYGKFLVGQIDDPFISCVYTVKADYVE